ncbi:MAG: hypothetical protein GY898_22665 [Proteobacteria bacterium]|nr:hypothetical protein [Pseudomonadota bacterium]
MWEVFRIFAVVCAACGLVVCVPTDDDDSVADEEPTPAVPTPEHFSWGDPLVCADPGDGWSGRFSEEGTARGLLRELPGLPDGEIFRGTGAVAVSDLDLDSDLDIVVAAVVHGPDVYLNDGTGQFVDGPELTHNAPGPPNDLASLVAVVDIDDDPYPEVITLGRDLLVWDDHQRWLLRPAGGDRSVGHGPPPRPHRRRRRWRRGPRFVRGNVQAPVGAGRASPGPAAHPRGGCVGGSTPRIGDRGCALSGRTVHRPRPGR